MRNAWRQFFRENLFGVSLVMIGILFLALAGLTHAGHWKAPGVVLAAGTAVDGPDTNILAQENRAYERLAGVVTPAIVNIRTTNRRSPWTPSLDSFLETCSAVNPTFLGRNASTRWEAASFSPPMDTS